MGKRGFNSTITELYKETNKIQLIPRDQVSKLVESVNQIRGNNLKNEESESVLFEWWKVFWNILKENKQKQQQNNTTENTTTEIIPSNTNNFNKRQLESYNSSILGQSSKTSSIFTEHPYKKLKKKPFKAPTQPMNTLDITSLTGIEKSLTLTNLMNKDLTKLSREEVKNIEAALRHNKVTKESWEMYLRLCKEYQKIPQVLSNSKINYYGPNPDFTTMTVNGSAGNSNYLGVIDQVNQPIDSRQLLIFRQTLYQEYLKKQNGSSTVINRTDDFNNTVSNSASSTKSDVTCNVSINLNDTEGFDIPTFTNPFFEACGLKDDINITDLMNEYLI